MLCGGLAAGGLVLAKPGIPIGPLRLHHLSTRMQTMPRATVRCAAVTLIIATFAACRPTHPAQPIVAPVAHPATRVARVTLDVHDLSPRFLTFYAAANADSISPARRWALWQALYGFAAVPPGPAGDSLARALLEHGWPQYPPVLTRIRTAGPAAADEARRTVDTIAQLLELEQPLHVQLTLYVGALEGNAYTIAPDSVPIVALPLEGPPEQRTLLAAHELTHAVHFGTAHLPGGWERSIAQTVLSEGLAMRTTQRVHPGLPDAAYTEYHAGWLREADARRRAILTGIRGSLSARDGATVARFIYGTGSTGVEREAYYVGWLVVGELLERGMSLADVARIPVDRMPTVVGDAIDASLRAAP
jgi:hypothetical protein